MLFTGRMGDVRHVDFGEGNVGARLVCWGLLGVGLDNGLRGGSDAAVWRGGDGGLYVVVGDEEVRIKIVWPMVVILTSVLFWMVVGRVRERHEGEVVSRERTLIRKKRRVRMVKWQGSHCAESIII